ncbi:minor capsid protein [Actinomadura macra]|uniref:minor capsid protein n=1 Tax=Actinomadura macra TaxID=46164 RepID=UPI00082A1998|nr:minor capsid protein [Actinomadura macra]
MGWHTSLLTGLAAHLAANGVGTWRPDGTAYAPAETAIVLGKMPPHPDRVIALNTYPVGQDGIGDVTVGLQVRARAGRDPRTALDLADAARDILDGAVRLNLGGVWVSQISHRNGEELTALPTADTQADRVERVDNYYLQASRITALRSP